MGIFGSAGGDQPALPEILYLPRCVKGIAKR